MNESVDGTGPASRPKDPLRRRGRSAKRISWRICSSRPATRTTTSWRKWPPRPTSKWTPTTIRKRSSCRTAAARTGRTKTSTTTSKSANRRKRAKSAKIPQGNATPVPARLATTRRTAMAASGSDQHCRNLKLASMHAILSSLHFL